MILASAMSKACNEEDGSGCFRSVYITKDFGASWTYLINYIVQFDWVHNLEKEQAKGEPILANSISFTLCVTSHAAFPTSFLTSRRASG